MYSHISRNTHTTLVKVSARRKGPLCNIFSRGHGVPKVLSLVLQILFAQLTGKKHQVEWATPRFTSRLDCCPPNNNCFGRANMPNSICCGGLPGFPCSLTMCYIL